MGLRHRTLAVEGVQFHPESIMTECGHQLLKNFLRAVRRDCLTGESTDEHYPQEALQRTIEHREIFFDEMLSLMRRIMAGELAGHDRGDPDRAAGQEGDHREIAAAATVMRELATKVVVPPPHDHFVDVVGTGGDGAHTFNISTATISSPRPLGHGWRSTATAASRPSPAVPTCSKRWGESALSPSRSPNASPPPASASCSPQPPQRDEERRRGAQGDGVRTIFNILGPLTNPASAPNTLMGVSTPTWWGSRCE